jgi:hypothetical protein
VVGLEGSKKGNSKSGQNQRVTRFSEILGAAKPDTQPVENSDGQISGYPDAQPSKKPVAKRNDPNYVQCSFRIPKRLSKEIDRVLLDLDDADIQCDRSDFLEEIAAAFMRIAKDQGVAEAWQQFKSLGTQIDE